MHENQFAHDVLAKLGDLFGKEDLETIRTALSLAATDYTIDRKETAVVPFSGTMIPSFYEAYLICMKVAGKSGKTIYLYNLYLTDFFRAVCKPMHEVTANDIRAYLAKTQLTRGVSNRSLDHRRLVINTFLHWAHTEKYIPENPCETVKPIKYEVKERKPLTGEEMYILRDSLTEPRDKAMLAVLYSTGCRVSELIGLKREDVDIEAGTVHLFGKGSKHRTSYLNAEAKVTLQRYLETRTDTEDTLFVSMRSPARPLTKNAVEARLKKLAQKAGIDRNVFPHLIRHTTATDALNRGMPVTELQAMLGHTKLETTMIYAKVNNSNVQHSHARCIA